MSFIDHHRLQSITSRAARTNIRQVMRRIKENEQELHDKIANTFHCGFAFMPVRLSNGKWIWLKKYYYNFLPKETRPGDKYFSSLVRYVPSRKKDIKLTPDEYLIRKLKNG
jgi:hypothetical protein